MVIRGRGKARCSFCPTSTGLQIFIFNNSSIRLQTALWSGTFLFWGCNYALLKRIPPPIPSTLGRQWLPLAPHISPWNSAHISLSRPFIKIYSFVPSAVSSLCWPGPLPDKDLLKDCWMHRNSWHPLKSWLMMSGSQALKSSEYRVGDWKAWPTLNVST